MRKRSRRDERPREWGIALDLGPHWYPLPLDQDPQDYARFVTEVLAEDSPAELGRQVPREVAEAVAAEMGEMAAAAQRTGAWAASVYRPVYDGSVLAMLTAHVHPPLEEDLRNWVEREYAGADARCTLTEVDLPTGPALRAHLLSGPVDEPNADQVVVETVAHFLTAPDAQVVQLSLSWTELVRGEELGELADGIARDLAFQ
jgi:hypothetical protein